MSLLRRIRRLEDARKPLPQRVPHVIHVAFGETIEQAKARFVAEWAPIPRGHHVLIVPARIDAGDKEALFEQALNIQQNRLRAGIIAARPTQPKDMAP